MNESCLCDAPETILKSSNSVAQTYCNDEGDWQCLFAGDNHRLRARFREEQDTPAQASALKAAGCERISPREAADAAGIVPSFRPSNTGTRSTNGIDFVWRSANMHTSRTRSMRLPFANNLDPTSWASRMRRARLSGFLELLPPGDTQAKVLDVGGTEKFWASVWNEQCHRLSITLLNLTAAPVSGALPIESIAGDARDLSQFEDLQFDLCFSNSVIEHVGTLADQGRMAGEIRRVANGYFVQTPYRYFPVEPHFHVPGWAQLPVWCRTALHQRLNLGWFSAEADYIQARMDVEQIRLLSLREFRSLFEDAEIRSEKVGPLIKSLIAVRPLASGAPRTRKPLVSAARA